MYKDIISYELAEGTSKERLLEVAEQVFNNWMKHQPGFISWEINVDKDNSFTDIVCWETEKDVKNSEQQMGNIPNVNDWFSCYKEGSTRSKNLIRLGVFS